MICKRCQSIFLESRPDEHLWRLHHSTRASLLESAQQGCQICSPLWFYFCKENQARLQSYRTSNSVSSVEDGLLDERSECFTQYMVEGSEEYAWVYFCSPLREEYFRRLWINDLFTAKGAGVKSFFVQSIASSKFQYPSCHCIALMSTEGLELPREATEFTSNTGSCTCSHLIIQWLTDCVDNHVLCKQSVDPTWHPSRLLDIGLAVGSGPKINL